MKDAKDVIAQEDSAVYARMWSWLDYVKEWIAKDHL